MKFILPAILALGLALPASLAGSPAAFAKAHDNGVSDTGPPGPGGRDNAETTAPGANGTGVASSGTVSDVVSDNAKATDNNPNEINN